VGTPGSDLPTNPADHRRPDQAGRLPDASSELSRAVALARAALPLVGVDSARTRDLLAELVGLLEVDECADVVSLASERLRRR